MAQSQISRSQAIQQYQPVQQTQSQTRPFSKQLSYPNNYNSDVPTGYPCQVGPGGSISMYHSMNQNRHTSSNQFNRASGISMGIRSNSQGNLARQSRSLGASKASLADEKLGKTSIHREYQDRKLRRNLKSPNYGKGRAPFTISIVLFVIGSLLILAGVTVLLLRFHNNVMLSIDKGEIIGPLLVALGIATIAGGIKFYYDAYIISNRERNKIKFTAASDSLIRATTTNAKSYKAPGEILMSGSVSANAVSRTPHGSMGSLNNI